MPAYDDELDARMMFAEPGGRSALRAASARNPRVIPCPTCHGADRLTPEDVAHGYQCDRCAEAAERGEDRDLVCSQDVDCPICAEALDDFDRVEALRPCPTCGTTQGDHPMSCENRPEEA